MSRWLEGRRALVVGAGSGIGRAVASAYVEEGARVAVLDHDADKCAALREELPPGTPVTQGDAAKSAGNEAAVSAAAEAFGGLDILVNCVGVFDFYRGIRELETGQIDESFTEIFSANVKSHIHSAKAALPHLEESAGSIILTESTSAYYPGRGGVLYVSSKFAVRGLVTALAHELAPAVRVNAVAPGGTVNTDLRGAGSLGLKDRRLDDSPNRSAELAARVPLGVALSGQDHASSYVFLASERARGITGDVLHSDGGTGIKG
ncbi:3-(cis-5,6-dihydroxycyclohexa-1,3-dien-1-yl)propanoate dehydrogenase [Nocardiopsis nanhaiensis]